MRVRKREKEEKRKREREKDIIRTVNIELILNQSKRHGDATDSTGYRL